MFDYYFIKYIKKGGGLIIKNDYFKRLNYCIGIFFILFSLASYSAKDTYIIKNEEVFHIKTDGTKNKLSDVKISKEYVKSGVIKWISVSPENELENELETEEMMDSEGIYFFNEKNVLISFLPYDHPEHCIIEFSPQRDYMIVFHGYGIIRDCKLYDLQNFKLKDSFSILVPHVWIDNNRVLLTIFDENRKNPRYEDVSLSSIVIYDIPNRKKEILKTETETKNYFLEIPNLRKGELEIKEQSVKNIKDWEDESKIKEKKIKITLKSLRK